MITPHALEDALGHLGAAIVQSIPTDDQIIMEHVRAAHAILREAFRAHLAVAHRQPKFVLTPANTNADLDTQIAGVRGAIAAK